MLLLLICAAVSVFCKTYDATWLLGISIGTISIGLGFIAIGMSVKTDKYLQIMLSSLYGDLNQAISAQLDLARIRQSHQLSGPGIEDKIYESGGRRQLPFYFGNAWIRLDSMKEGDVIRIRVYVTEDGVESKISEDADNTYTGTQTTMARISGGFYNQEGIRITAEHVAVVSSPLTIGCYAYDAMRGI